MIDCKDTVQARIFYIEQTVRLLTSDVFKKEEKQSWKKTKIKKQNYGKIFVRDHSGQCPVQYLENIGPATEQSDGLILVIGPLN